jgi:tRNA G18 (ribose-2'-O)-methylase SpoU
MPNFCLINDIANPLLDPYRDLTQSNVRRSENTFIAEGRLVVEQLLASDFEIVSVLVSDARLHRIESRLPADVLTMIVSHAMCSELVGFNFHAGVLACGRRRTRPAVEIDKLPVDVPVTLVACPQVSMPDNLGSIIRLAAAFQIDGVIAGPFTADPFSRRVVRVSMGNIFRVPIFEPPNFEAEIERLTTQAHFDVVGATRSPGAIGLTQFQRSTRTILMLGNEAEGLRVEWLSLCNRQVTIEMSPTVDSLNVATAAGILMYELMKK